MPRWISAVLLVLATLALVPFACVFKARVGLSPVPRIHLVQDMDNQPRYKPQRVNPLFADGRSDRPPVEGTVPRGRRDVDDAFHLGTKDGAWVTTFPVRVDDTLMRRGRERFDIYCSPCHGLAGYGDGIVAARAERLQEGTWVPPASLHDPVVVARPAGHIFNTISRGIRTMPSYGSQIPEADRWAIVAYVRALQKSQRAPVTELTEAQRAGLREVAP